MIQSFREKLSGIVAIAIIVLIAIPLAFFGVDSLFFNSNRVSSIGSVNGRDISELDFERAVVARDSQIRQLLGDNYSADIVDSARIRSAALTGLVDLFLFLTQAEDHKMGASDLYVSREIQQIPQFQVNGEFSDVLFSNYLSQFGFTASTFIAAIKEELVSSQLQSGLQTSAIATKQLLEKNIAVSQEKRNYQTIVLSVDSVLEKVVVSEDEIATYYQENGAAFSLPERISLDYVQLSAQDFLQDVEVSQEEVEQRFELVQTSLPARRQAAHILVEVQPDDSHLPVLDEIQQKLDQGADFEELAAEYSSDIGSSGNGGLLGYTDGTSFPEAFEVALAELEVGQVSSPVLTDAGLHIIKLVNLDQETLALEDEYANLEAEIRLQKASELYQQNLEAFRDAVFTANDIDELIQEFSAVKVLEPLVTDFFVRQSGQGIAANETLRAAAFSENVLERQWIEMLEIDDDATSLAFRLRERIEAGVAPMEEVRDQIVENLTRAKGTALLEEQALDIQARLQAGEEAEDVARDQDVEWQVQLDALRGTGGGAGQAVFAASVSGGLPAIGSSVQPNGDYLIFSIDEVSAGRADDFNEIQLSQLSTQLSQVLAASEAQAYLETLRANADIDFKIDVEY